MTYTMRAFGGPWEGKLITVPDMRGPFIAPLPLPPDALLRINEPMGQDPTFATVVYHVEQMHYHLPPCPWAQGMASSLLCPPNCGHYPFLYAPAEITKEEVFNQANVVLGIWKAMRGFPIRIPRRIYQKRVMRDTLLWHAYYSNGECSCGWRSNQRHTRVGKEHCPPSYLQWTEHTLNVYHQTVVITERSGDIDVPTAS